MIAFLPYLVWLMRRRPVADHATARGGLPDGGGLAGVRGDL